MHRPHRSPSSTTRQWHEHPGERTYIKVAVILAIITIAEVAIYYIEAWTRVLVPTLLIMSVVKFLYRRQLLHAPEVR